MFFEHDQFEIMIFQVLLLERSLYLSQGWLTCDLQDNHGQNNSESEMNRQEMVCWQNVSILMTKGNLKEM